MTLFQVVIVTSISSVMSELKIILKCTENQETKSGVLWNSALILPDRRRYLTLHSAKSEILDKHENIRGSDSNKNSHNSSFFSVCSASPTHDFGNPSQLSFSTVFLRVCKVLFLTIFLPQAGFQSDHSLYLHSTVSHLPRNMIFSSKTYTALD